MSQKIINAKPGSLLDLLTDLFKKGMRIANNPATNTNQRVCECVLTNNEYIN